MKKDKVPTALIRLWLESNGCELVYEPYAAGNEQHRVIRNKPILSDPTKTIRVMLSRGVSPVQAIRFAVIVWNDRARTYTSYEPTPWPWANINNFM